jgi:hypothetical protein
MLTHRISQGITAPPHARRRSWPRRGAPSSSPTAHSKRSPEMIRVSSAGGVPLPRPSPPPANGISNLSETPNSACHTSRTRARALGVFSCQRELRERRDLLLACHPRQPRSLLNAQGEGRPDGRCGGGGGGEAGRRGLAGFSEWTS